MTTTTPVTMLDAQQAVRTLLAWCGYDPTINGLADTPTRVVSALTEMTAAEHIDPGVYLERVFESKGMDVDSMIMLRRIPFTSLCEHHILPFVGFASVAYLPAPGAPIVGLSKLARVVDGYARRLQVQERLTTQIHECIDQHTSNKGVAVTLHATHTCMSMRGVRKEAIMVTSKLSGAFRDQPTTRAEFFALDRTP